MRSYLSGNHEQVGGIMGRFGARNSCTAASSRTRHMPCAWVKCCSRLPTHLAHPLENERAVVIHALGTSLQGSRQNRGEPCRLLPADISGCGSIVVTTRRLCSINTRAPFDHVEVDLQNAPLAEDEFG